MRKVNMITYDLIKESFGWALENNSHLNEKGKRLNIIINPETFAGGYGFNASGKQIFKQFRIR